MTYGEEEITDIMGEEDAYAHVGKVEAVTTPDESDGDDMVEDEFFVVFAWLFQSENQNDGLLQPECSL